MQKVYEFIEKCCLEQGIDDSHGLIHSKHTVEWAELLMDSLNVYEDERKFVMYGAALHDMCDSKYIEVEKGQAIIYQWLLDTGWEPDVANALIQVIGSTSYTKLKQARIKGEIVYPTHGKWQRAYHIIRHADLLDAYKVERCMLYNMHIHPEMASSDAWKVVSTLFENRVFNYVSEGWLFYPKALELVPDLEKKAREDIKNSGFVYI
jgi:hypothetical protein